MFKKMKKTDFLFYGSLILISVLVFAIPCGLAPFFVPDSPAYLAGTMSQGIVPVYPLFISLNKLIFSSSYYLQAIVMEQILFAACVSVFFALFVRKEMGAGRIETYLIWGFSMIPYTIFMPVGMVSRFIATEALAYPLFYLLMLLIMKGVWENRITLILGAEVLAIFMALIRTQLQLVLVLPIVIFFLFWMRGKARNEKMRMLPRIFAGFGISFMIFVASYGIYRQSNLILQHFLAWTVNKANACMEGREDINAVAEVEESEVIESESAEPENPAVQTANAEDSQNVVSQYTTVLFAKVMIMAAREDADLFEDTDMRQLYTYVYDRLEQDQMVLHSMDHNLLIADQLQIAHADMSRNVHQYLNDFTYENPDSGLRIGEATNEFLMVLLKAHPFRWMICGFLQLPFGFISSVCIHVRTVYWISYLATAVIYVLAVGLSIVRRRDVKRRDFMAVCIGVNFLFVIATSMVFMSLKRYVNYGFGVFYISLYFMIRGYVDDLCRKKQNAKGE